MENKYIRLLQFLIGTEVDGDFGVNSRAAADRLIEKLQLIYDELSEMLRKRGEQK